MKEGVFGKNIIVGARKVIYRGERHVKILKLEARRVADLPKLYTQKDGAVWFSTETTRGSIMGKGAAAAIEIVTIDNTYRLDRFERIMDTLKEAGNLLVKVNADIKEMHEGDDEEWALGENLIFKIEGKMTSA